MIKYVCIFILLFSLSKKSNLDLKEIFLFRATKNKQTIILAKLLLRFNVGIFGKGLHLLELKSINEFIII